MRQAKAVYSELAIPRELAIIIGILAATQRQAKVRESLMMDKETASGMP